MKEVIIRQANVNDAKDILDINISSWKDTYKNIFPDDFLDNLCNTEEEYNKSLNNIIEKITDNNNYLVSLYKDRIVGFVNYGPSKKNKYIKYGEIYALYVDNNYIKKGIGGMLLKKATSLLKNNHNNIIVSCLKKNPANTFYEKMGCKKIGETTFDLNNKKYKENVYLID